MQSPELLGRRHDHAQDSSFTRRSTARVSAPCTVLLAALAAACSAPLDESVEQAHEAVMSPDSESRLPKYRQIRDLARLHGLSTTAYLLAGIAITETGLVHCWSEATWACQGPPSPDCGGGPVIAGAADGPCSHRQGGLGMFQFDAGTYADTIAKYGERVLLLEGQVPLAIGFVVDMVRRSVYISGVDTDAQARAWLDRFDPNDGARRDQWIRTVVRYYNGCQPSWSCWTPRLRTYANGLSQALSEPGGPAFWRAETCGAVAGVEIADGERSGVVEACEPAIGESSDDDGVADETGATPVAAR